MFKDKYSIEIRDSVIVFHLLEGNFLANLENLNNSAASSRFLAVKSIYIDLCSFLSELTLFKGVLHKSSKVSNYRCINDFLLQSHVATKMLNRHWDAFKKIRNLVFAHNYRDAKDFIEPSTHFKKPNAPQSVEELKCFVELVMLIISIVKESFPLHSNIAYSYMYKSSMDSRAPVEENVDKTISIKQVDSIKREIYLIKEALKNKDNYVNVSRSIRCNIKETPRYGATDANVLGHVLQ